MGGAVMVGAVVAATLLWCNLGNRYLLTVLVGAAVVRLRSASWTTLAKWRARSGNRGMTEAKKLVLQGAFAAGLVGAARQPVDRRLPAREAAHLYVPVREDRRSPTRSRSTCRWSSSS